MSKPLSASEWKARAMCYIRTPLGIADLAVKVADEQVAKTLRAASEALTVRDRATATLHDALRANPAGMAERVELCNSQFNLAFRWTYA